MKKYLSIVLVTMLFALIPMVSAEPSASAARNIEIQNLDLGGTTNVTVTIMNNVSQALSLMETIPSGWTLTRVSDDASAFKNSTNEWVWFNVGAGVTKTVIYRLNVQSNAAPGIYHVNGNITNASGIIASVSGDNSINVSGNLILPEQTFNISGFKINNDTGSGIQGWNITLMNSTMQTSMLTGSDGSYKFTNLVNGTYNVTEETRPEFTNVSPTTVQVIIAGSDVMDINFTNQPKAVVVVPTFNISGFKINGTNNNGTGIPGWNITLKNDTIQLTTMTNASGFYNFTNLVNGSYNVSEEVKMEWMNITPTSQNVTINGSDVTDVNFVNILIPPKSPATFNISGYKLNAATGSGIQGWIIMLKNATTNTPIFNTTTNTAGFYQFTNLANGTYNVSEETRAGFTPASATFQVVTVAGHDVMNVNFTNTPVTPVKLGSISGTKFNDSDGNGIRESNEAGLPNWTIVLKDSTGATVATTLTASNGSYKFSNLSAGNYTVGEILKPNWIQTAPKPVPPGTYMVTITVAGEEITGKDFGNMLVPPPPPTVNGSLSGFGINTATGKGLPNVTIRLVGIVGMGVDTKSIRAETMTDPMGKWMFDNLPAGRYIIIEQLPKGFIPVTPPVMNLMLAKGQNSMDNNFTNRPVESLIPKLPLPPTPQVTGEQESK